MKWCTRIVFFIILSIPSIKSVDWLSLYQTGPENDALEFAQSGSYVSLQHNSLPVTITTELSISYACPIADSNMKKEEANSLTRRSLLIQKAFSRCYTPVEPSILQIKDNHFTVGFEVYMAQFKLLCLFNIPIPKLNRDFCWFFVIDIRFNTKSLQLMFMVHILSNFGLKQTNIDLQQLTLGKDLLPKDVDLNYLYSEKNQANIFSETKSQYFDWEAGKHLEPQFLIDPEDFYYSIHKKTALNYANIVPMWKNIKNGSWKLLNESLRNTLRENDYFTVVTGTYEILQLPNRIFLMENDKMPVPYAFWKLIRFVHSIKEDGVTKTTYYDIFIVVHNHPYEENPKQLCPNICNKYGWNAFFNENPETGYAYCCEVNVKNSYLFNLVDFWENDPTQRDVLDLNSYKDYVYANY